MEKESQHSENPRSRRAVPNSPDSLPYLVEKGKLTPEQAAEQLSRSFSARADAFIPYLSTSPTSPSLIHLAARKITTYKEPVDSTSSTSSDSDSHSDMDDLLTSKAFIESERARETLGFCKVCRRSHIRPGPESTLPARDTCGSFLPVWHPKTPGKDPWVPFLELFKLIQHCGEQEFPFNSMDRRPAIDGPGGLTAFMYPMSFEAHRAALGGWVYFMLKQWGHADISLVECIVNRFGNEKIAAIEFDPTLLGTEETGYVGSEPTYSPIFLPENFLVPKNKATSGGDTNRTPDGFTQGARSRGISELQLPESAASSQWSVETSSAPRGRSPTGRFVNASSRAYKMTENIKPGDGYPKSMAASFVGSDPTDDYAREYYATKKDELGFGDVDDAQVKGKAAARATLASKPVNTEGTYVTRGTGHGMGQTGYSGAVGHGGFVGAGGMGHGLGQTGYSDAIGHGGYVGGGGMGHGRAMAAGSKTVDYGGPVGGGMHSSHLGGYNDPTVRATSPNFVGTALELLSVESPSKKGSKDKTK